jgi:pteridine reductase
MPAVESRPVAVVTAAARRLGAAIALALARGGHDVVVHHRSTAADAEAIAVQARALGARSITVQGDVAHAADVARLLDATLSAFGRADVLVANAGAFQRTPLATLTEEQWDDLLTNNLRATFLCAQRFGLHMRSHDGGCIVSVSDVAGLRPWAEYLPYNIAKAGIVTLTHTLAKELAPSVRVNAVALGPVLFPDDYDPALRQREIGRTLLQRQGRADNVADAVLALVRNDYITGVVLPVDGGRLLA